MHLATRLVADTGVVAQASDDVHVVLHVATGKYYTLDGVGGRIFELCDGTRALADVAAEICTEYDAAPAEIQADVLEFASELVSERLLLEAV